VAMILIRDQDGAVLLVQRPPSGIWGGLWSLPECDPGEDVKAWCRRRLGLKVKPESPWPVLSHTFTHFRLHITPITARLLGPSDQCMETGAAVWYKPHSPDRRGLAAPVKRLLEQLRNST
jgi:A/G-specific adenine glycosylase